MGRDLFESLPSELIINILSRLPARTATSCKCVCKPWLDLLTSPEFVKSYLSKVGPCLALLDWGSSKPYKIVEFLNELDSRDECCWNVVFSFRPPFHQAVHSSANGLLLLCNPGYRPSDLILCNPVTRDYIRLPCPTESCSKSQVPQVTVGLGVNRMSEQFKVVRIFSGMLRTCVSEKLGVSECQVYTVGTGSWRRIASPGLLYYDYEYGTGAFLNGNLHWLVFDLKSRTPRISCFDLETELFSTFSLPPRVCDDPDRCRCRKLSVLRDCLCFCSTGGKDADIWLMKEYGDEKSWRKEFVIREEYYNDIRGCICPIKVFQDGDILMKFNRLLYYSSKTKRFREVDVSGLDCMKPDSSPCCPAIYTPSFVRLRTFATENVSSF